MAVYWAEYQDIKRDEDELDARWNALFAKVNEAIDKRIGERPSRDRPSALEAWTTQRNAIEEEVAPELDDVGHQWEKVRELTGSLENLLLATPAPDTAALLLKLNLLWGPDMEGDDRTHGDEIPVEQIRATLTDARRLLSVEA